MYRSSVVWFVYHLVVPFFLRKRSKDDDKYFGI
jgi:hypothetical protein